MQYLCKFARRYNLDLAASLNKHSNILTRQVLDKSYQDILDNPEAFPWIKANAPGYFIGKIKKTRPQFRTLFYFEHCPKLFILWIVKRCMIINHLTPKPTLLPTRSR